jgi:sugar lactone lactonase YvrE
VRRAAVVVVGACAAVFLALVPAGALGVSGDDTIATFAGTGEQGFSGDGGPATAARLAFPEGLAIDADGSVYISDPLDGRVRRVSGGTISTFAGRGPVVAGGPNGDGGPATAASLLQPLGLAVDRQGNVYIADGSSDRVRKVSGGTISTFAGSGVEGFSGDGGPATAAALNFAADVAADAQGNVYIADGFNARVRRVSGGTITTVAGTGTRGALGDGGPARDAQLDGPISVAVDARGNLYIAEVFNHRIRMVRNGVISTIAGTGEPGFSGDGGPATAARLSSPSGVEVDRLGNVYIVDAGNLRVRRVSGSTIATIAGTGTQGSVGDGGPARDAQLASPQSVAVDARGNLYIADGRGRRVRMVANPQPVASLTASRRVGPVPLRVRFDGSGSSDRNGSVVAFAWEFGDGRTGSGSTASHVYSRAGTFRVRLTVTDDAGAVATAQRTITVRAAARCVGQRATIVGTGGRDRLRGTSGRDVIAGLGGADVIDGLGGDDLVCAGAGDDVVRGGPGADRLFGGPGRDRLLGGAGEDVERQ